MPGAPGHKLESATMSTHILSQVLGGKHKQATTTTIYTLFAYCLVLLILLFASCRAECIPSIAFTYYTLASITTKNVYRHVCSQIIVASHNELRCPECRVLIEIKIDDLPPNVLLMRILGGKILLRHI